MKILFQSLRSRYNGEIDVALYGEIPAGSLTPTAWITTSADRPGHEWRHDTEAAAQAHYAQLANARLDRIPSRYSEQKKPARQKPQEPA